MNKYLKYISIILVPINSMEFTVTQLFDDLDIEKQQSEPKLSRYRVTNQLSAAKGRWHKKAFIEVMSSFIRRAPQKPTQPMPRPEGLTTKEKNIISATRYRIKTDNEYKELSQMYVPLAEDEQLEIDRQVDMKTDEYVKDYIQKKVQKGEWEVSPYNLDESQYFDLSEFPDTQMENDTATQKSYPPLTPPDSLDSDEDSKKRLKDRHATRRRGIFLEKYRHHACLYLEAPYKKPSPAKAFCFNNADRALLKKLHALDKEKQSEIMEKIRTDYLHDYQQYISSGGEAPIPEKQLLTSFNGFLKRYIRPSEPL